MNPIRPFLDHTPQIRESCLIDETSVIIGEVSLAEDVSVWPHAVLRGDVNSISIGDRVLIGMGTIILDDTVIEDDVMIGAGSLVPPRKRLESGYLYVGSPVKQARLLTEKEKEFLKYSSAHYVRLSGQHKQSK